MPNEFAQWNAAAVRILRTLFESAASFTTSLENVEIRTSIERLPSPWPSSSVPGASESRDGPWPPELKVEATWQGGATSLRVLARVARGKAYAGLVSLEVLTRMNGTLLWLNVPTSLSRSSDGVAHLRALSAILKRKDNTEQSELVATMAKRAQIPPATRGTLSLGQVRVADGSFVTEPEEAFQRLVKLCLLKLPLFSTNPRDIDGEYFMQPGALNEEVTPAFETVTATAHAGLMLPVLRALDEGAVSPIQIEDNIARHFGSDLTAGDRRKKPDGNVLWRYNVRWALTYLKQRGEVENPARSQWAITTAGRERLAKELSGFSLRNFQTLQAKVPVDGSTSSVVESERLVQSMPPVQRLRAWRERLADVLDQRTLDHLASRLRPDLGASPSVPVARNIVLVGPPGTGKTWIAKKVALALTGEPSMDESELVELVQFHPSYGYEDFIWGIRPILNCEAPVFREAIGPFLKICRDAIAEPDELFVLIIDEINRGDPARIFGELLYALEYRGQEVTLASGIKLTVPTNLVVLGTMNSVDRSVAMVDYALRRRFTFLRIEPKPELISVHHDTRAGFAAARALTAVNQRIVELGDRELQLGHSYFLAPGRDLNSEADLAGVWELDLAPQLAELFHGRASTLQDLASVWHEALMRAHADYQEQDDPDEDEGGA